MRKKSKKDTLLNHHIILESDAIPGKVASFAESGRKAKGVFE